MAAKKTKKRKTKDDKRKHPRYPVGLAMDIHAKGHSVQKCRGTITDLSVAPKTSARMVLSPRCWATSPTTISVFFFFLSFFGI